MTEASGLTLGELRRLVREIEWARFLDDQAVRERDWELKPIRKAEAEIAERRLRERLSGLSLRDLLGNLLDDVDTEASMRSAVGEERVDEVGEPVDGVDQIRDVVRDELDRSDRASLVGIVDAMRDHLVPRRDRVELGPHFGEDGGGAVSHDSSSRVAGQALESPGPDAMTLEDAADVPLGVGGAAAAPEGAVAAAQSTHRVPRAVQLVLSDFWVAHRAEVDDLLAPFGLTAEDVLMPTFRAVDR